MRLLRVKLTDVRGVAPRGGRFAPDGVTIVEAPNETGKSTLLEAVDVLLEVKDSSRSQRVKDLQPVDRDVPSTIEVELTCGGYHLTCTKTYHRQTATVLTIHAPTRETLRGTEAHDRLRAILDAEVDPALYAALRFAQGRDLAPSPSAAATCWRPDSTPPPAGPARRRRRLLALRDRGVPALVHADRPPGPGAPSGRAGTRGRRAGARRARRPARPRCSRRRCSSSASSDGCRSCDAADRAAGAQLAAADEAVAEVHEARTALAARRADHVAATTDLAAARRPSSSVPSTPQRAADLRRRRSTTQRPP
jgi:hypothetical protein